MSRNVFDSQNRSTYIGVQGSKPKPHISHEAWQVIKDILATSPCGTDASIGELHEDATKRRVLAVLEHKLEVR
ncbi:MAG: hypothetical protein [Caudoviricetes sp.]|nr:MAG: hypothetical protein [Caudoviricetes sp.]